MNIFKLLEGIPEKYRPDDLADLAFSIFIGTLLLGMITGIIFMGLWGVIALVKSLFVC